MNDITMKMQADQLIRMALQEDITSEDVSTNAVMRSAVKGTVDLIAKEDGIIAGLDVYARVFQILDEKTEISFNFKDGDAVKKGDAVVIIEAMKMEIPVVAPQDGTVASIDVAVGDAIEAGAVLATLN